jgi:hypothetical protein
MPSITFPSGSILTPTVLDLSAKVSNIYSTVGANSSVWSNPAGSAKWNSSYSSVSSLSSNWEKSGVTYTWVQNNSSIMDVDKIDVGLAGFANSSIKLAVAGDAVIYGNLSALGTTTLVNVTASVTDALSVVNAGFGENAIRVAQQGGSLDAVKITHAGSGNLMTLEGTGNVGIGNSVPNKKLTVTGTISAVAPNGGLLENTSDNWYNTFTILQNLSSEWNQSTSIVSSNSAKYNNTSSTTQTLSSNWQSAHSILLALSTLWSTASINYVIDGDGAPVTTGSKGVLYLPTGFKVSSWRVLSETATTAKIDIRRFPSGTYKTTSLSSDSLLIDVNNPEVVNLLTLTNSPSAFGGDSIFADISANDILEFYVVENDLAHRFTIGLGGVKTI